MIFTDWTFFVFFPVAFSVYWMLGDNRWRKLWLLACSVVFYSAWDWRFLALVLLDIVNTYLVAMAVGEWAPEKWRKRILIIGIVISLCTLGFFKYFNFFADSLARIVHVDFTIRNIVLPIGISFYTFHSLSYTIDAYRRKIAPTRNVADIALFIMFFPQLVAGPIVRATQLLPQLREARSFAAVNFKYFLTLFLIGYFKKAVISDNVSPLVDTFFAHPANFPAGDAAVGVFLYAVQIYCDFSGYTDMAIAIAGMLGYQLKANFNHPYLSPNLIEFWRRWHMSLSFWLRDYLYVPLGGNRGGALFQARNIFITMLLGGLWHGASWTFVAWGALHGAALIVNRAWQGFRQRQQEREARYSVIGNLLTFAFVCFAWIFFRAPDFSTAATVIHRFAVPGLPTLLAWQWAVTFAVVLCAVHVLFYRINLASALESANDFAFACGYGAAAALVLPFVNVAVKPFIYFQF